MINERLYRTDAIILRRADFGEADRLITVFTPDRGKLPAGERSQNNQP
jgi:DNA repair protein RecO (recombination protein O)